MASPESLDSALCEAVQRGWWWGASRLVAAGASAHAAYKTTMWGQEEVTRYVYVYMHVCVCTRVCRFMMLKGSNDIVTKIECVLVLACKYAGI